MRGLEVWSGVGKRKQGSFFRRGLWRGVVRREFEGRLGRDNGAHGERASCVWGQSGGEVGVGGAVSFTSMTDLGCQRQEAILTDDFCGAG